MLFNSYGFMFVFLRPPRWRCSSEPAPYSRRAAASLTAASLFFYGWWNPTYLELLVGSIVFNYGAGRLVTRGIWSRSEASRRWILLIAITCDLLLLGYYKCANFFLGTVNSALHASYSLGEIVLPLGISFFHVHSNRIASGCLSRRREGVQTSSTTGCSSAIFRT